MAVPSTMTPGQTNDPVWEKILTENWNSHNSQFGVNWNTSKTTDAERAAQLARMQEAYRNATAASSGGSSGGSGGSGGSSSYGSGGMTSLSSTGKSAQLPAPHQNNPNLGNYAVSMPTTQVDPKTWQPPEALVENRLEGILAKDSPLMQRAQTEGMQYANSRGLLNSTMAAGAAQGAMIDRAMPIAQQDATFVSDLNKMGMSYNQDLGKMAHGHNLGLAQAEFTSKLDEDSKARLLNLEAQYARVLKFDDNAADAFKGAIGAIGMLNTNPDLSPEQQAAGTSQIIGMMGSHLNFLGNLYGTGDMVNINSTPSSSGSSSGGSYPPPTVPGTPSGTSGNFVGGAIDHFRNLKSG